MSSKSEIFEFSRGRGGGQKPIGFEAPRGVLTIIESIWNYGNLAYLVATTYGLNVIKIGGIWIFQKGQKPPIKGSYMWPAMPIFELGLAIPVKSHVWKFGLDWLSLSRVIIWIFRGDRNPLLGVLHVTCNVHFRIWLSYSSQKSSV